MTKLRINIQAILFDNDGVLVDTQTLFFETTRRSFVQLGLNLDGETWGRRYLTEGIMHTDKKRMSCKVVALNEPLHHCLRGASPRNY